jgi:hypothetical protein
MRRELAFVLPAAEPPAAGPSPAHGIAGPLCKQGAIEGRKAAEVPEPMVDSHARDYAGA